MIARLGAHPGVRSASSNWGALQKSGGTVKIFFPALCARIQAPHFQSASGATACDDN